MTTARATAPIIPPESPQNLDNTMGIMDEDIGAFMMDGSGHSPAMSGEQEVEDKMEDDAMMQAFLDEASDPIVDPATELALDAAAACGSTRQVSDSTHETETRACPGTLDESSSAPMEDLTVSQTPEPLAITGRPGIPLYLSCNPDHLSEYQCLIRKNIELFEATESDISSRIKGRNKPIVLGQVGIRCCHCRRIPIPQRERGSMYFPHSLVGIYQAAQILSQQHLLEACPHVPSHIRQELCHSKTKKSYATAGKEYWASTAKVLGVYEDQYGLRFEKRLGMVRHVDPH